MRHPRPSGIGTIRADTRRTQWSLYTYPWTHLKPRSHSTSSHTFSFHSVPSPTSISRYQQNRISPVRLRCHHLSSSNSSTTSSIESASREKSFRLQRLVDLLVQRNGPIQERLGSGLPDHCGGSIRHRQYQSGTSLGLSLS